MSMSYILLVGTHYRNYLIWPHMLIARIKWVGHVITTDQTRVAKLSSGGTPQGRRKMGWTTLRGLKVTENES